MRSYTTANGVWRHVRQLLAPVNGSCSVPCQTSETTIIASWSCDQAATRYWTTSGPVRRAGDNICDWFKMLAQDGQTAENNMVSPWKHEGTESGLSIWEFLNLRWDQKCINIHSETHIVKKTKKKKNQKVKGQGHCSITEMFIFLTGFWYFLITTYIHVYIDRNSSCINLILIKLLIDDGCWKYNSNYFCLQLLFRVGTL